jgi:hypothetical protein
MVGGGARHTSRCTHRIKNIARKSPRIKVDCHERKRQVQHACTWWRSLKDCGLSETKPVLSTLLRMLTNRTAEEHQQHERGP